MKIDPDGFHIMKKSRYSGMFGDYSSYSSEYDELNEGPEEESRMKSNEGIAVPYVIWMAIFVVAPADHRLLRLHEPGRRLHAGELLYHGPVYRRVQGRSRFLLAIIATFICLLIGYPLSYWLAQEEILRCAGWP